MMIQPTYQPIPTAHQAFHGKAINFVAHHARGQVNWGDIAQKTKSRIGQHAPTAPQRNWRKWRISEQELRHFERAHASHQQQLQNVDTAVRIITGAHICAARSVWAAEDRLTTGREVTPESLDPTVGLYDMQQAAQNELAARQGIGLLAIAPQAAALQASVRLLMREVAEGGDSS
ncbi:MAG: hypothetical protein WAX89_03040, partial [Alphaproteobacteria bacterium]